MRPLPMPDDEKRSMSGPAVRLVLVKKDGEAPKDMALGDSIEINLDPLRPIVLGNFFTNDVVVSGPRIGRCVVGLSLIQEGIWVDDYYTRGGSALEVDGVRTDRPHCGCPD